MAETVVDTRRLHSKPQNLNDAYGPPSNFLEIEVCSPHTVGVGRNRYTTYEVRLKTNLPIFKLKESCVRRRYSDFEWLRSELERESKVVVPALPGKALFRQLPFRGDEGIFDDSFIEERKQGLEQFINKRLLWTRQWTGDADSKRHMESLPYKGVELFGDGLSDLVSTATAGLPATLWHRMNGAFTCFYRMKS
ncbi:sorting nexin-3 isoform X1 [Pseudophryne corroboree]|uniref:sorting nexin-3 isoform X1 n=1 Tax=Pseudophryne corroboree TaxID=495146 RepID=UPI0030814F64